MSCKFLFLICVTGLDTKKEKKIKLPSKSSDEILVSVCGFTCTVPRDNIIQDIPKIKLLAA